MFLNGALTGMMPATMQNRQSTIQRDQYRELCVSHVVVPGVILQIACKFLVVLKNTQLACLTMSGSAVPKPNLKYLAISAIHLFARFERKFILKNLAQSNILYLNQLKLLIICEYCMLMYD